MPPVPPRRWSAAVIHAAAWVLATVLLGACTGDDQARYGMPQGATRQSHSTLHLWQGMFVTAAVVGAIVWALIFWSAIRYRKRRGDQGLPKQTQYHIPLEITYTIIPIIVVAVIFVFVVKVDNVVNHTSVTPAVSVRVEAFQWGWRFTYLNPDGSPIGSPVVGNETSPPTLKLPAHETVRLTLVSADVAHSFFVPDFLFKRDLIPRIDNTVDLYIDKVGTFPGHCAEFCGIHHADMGFQVVSVPRDQFAVAVAAAGAGAAP